MLRRIALEYLQYEESGATCWDTMIDVRKRPQWLKVLGEEAMAEDAAKYGDPRHLLQAHAYPNPDPDPNPDPNSD